MRLWGIGMGQSGNQEVGSIAFPLCTPPGYTCHTLFGSLNLEDKWRSWHDRECHFSKWKTWASSSIERSFFERLFSLLPPLLLLKPEHSELPRLLFDRLPSDLSLLLLPTGLEVEAKAA